MCSGDIDTRQNDFVNNLVEDILWCEVLTPAPIDKDLIEDEELIPGRGKGFFNHLNKKCHVVQCALLANYFPLVFVFAFHCFLMSRQLKFHLCCFAILS